MSQYSKLIRFLKFTLASFQSTVLTNKNLLSCMNQLEQGMLPLWHLILFFHVLLKIELNSTEKEKKIMKWWSNLTENQKKAPNESSNQMNHVAELYASRNLTIKNLASLLAQAKKIFQYQNSTAVRFWSYLCAWDLRVVSSHEATSL